MRLILALLLTIFTTSTFAVTKGYEQRQDYEGCNGIVDKDKRLYCQAMDANKEEFCKRIGNNDLQNKCLAKINNDEKFCKRISEEKKRKNCEQYIR